MSRASKEDILQPQSPDSPTLYQPVTIHGSDIPDVKKNSDAKGTPRTSHFDTFDDDDFNKYKSLIRNGQYKKLPVLERREILVLAMDYLKKLAALHQDDREKELWLNAALIIIRDKKFDVNFVCDQSENQSLLHYAIDKDWNFDVVKEILNKSRKEYLNLIAGKKSSTTASRLTPIQTAIATATATRKYEVVAYLLANPQVNLENIKSAEHGSAIGYWLNRGGNLDMNICGMLLSHPKQPISDNFLTAFDKWVSEASQTIIEKYSQKILEKIDKYLKNRESKSLDQTAKSNLIESRNLLSQKIDDKKGHTQASEPAATTPRTPKISVITGDNSSSPKHSGFSKSFTNFMRKMKSPFSSKNKKSASQQDLIEGMEIASPSDQTTIDIPSALPPESITPQRESNETSSAGLDLTSSLRTPINTSSLNPSPSASAVSSASATPVASSAHRTITS